MQSEGQAAQLKGFEQVWPLWLADSFCSATRAASLWSLSLVLRGVGFISASSPRSRRHPCCLMQVQAVHLSPEPFAVENDLLTPSFKLKRPQAKEKFQAAITAMYRRLEGAHG
jgi:hypothetical protein